MKTALILATLFSSSLFAGTIKTCSTTLEMPEMPAIPSKFEIIEEGGTLKAKVTQKVEGETSSYDDTATLAEYSVREGLTEESNPEELNAGENLVVHAMTLEGMGMSSGVSLKKVRYAKVYTIGEVTNMGGTAIVEARDSKNKLLGSYLGGFLVSPCK
jgi:hypothetical protein